MAGPRPLIEGPLNLPSVVSMGLTDAVLFCATRFMGFVHGCVDPLCILRLEPEEHLLRERVRQPECDEIARTLLFQVG